MIGVFVQAQPRLVHVFSAVAWMALGGFLVWFFTPQPVSVSMPSDHIPVSIPSQARALVEPEPAPYVISTASTKVERDAIDRCVKERNGQQLVFSRSGVDCYVYFPSSQSFQVAAPPVDDKAEARKLVAMKVQRTTQALADIQAQQFDFLPAYFHASGIDPAKHPQFVEMTRMVMNDSINVLLKVKASFKRARPHTVDPDVAPVILVPWHSSYPSGHATQAALFAHIFACANPAAKDKLEKLATSVGRNREIAGVHYPSDTEAGFALGKSIFDELVKNPKFSCLLK